MPKCLFFKSAITVAPNGVVKPCCLYKHKRSRDQRRISEDWQEVFERKSQELEQGWIDECDVCQQAESAGRKSDRIAYQDILSGASFEFWDLKLNNTCNLACRMCNPSSSSTWATQVKSNKSENWHKEYKTGLNNRSWFKNENMEYILKNIVHAKRVKFTGGEPFLIPQVEKIIDHLIETNSAKNITLRLISNGTVSCEKWIEKFKQFKQVIVTFSIDAVGELHEYIRAGSSWIDVENNIKELVKIKPDNTLVNATALNMALNKDHMTEIGIWANDTGIQCDTDSYVYYPKYMSMDVYNDIELQQQFIEQMEIQDKIHGTDWKKFVKF